MLKGLKENIIMGQLIPCGTGFDEHRNIKLVKNVLDNKKEVEGTLKKKKKG